MRDTQQPMALLTGGSHMDATVSSPPAPKVRRWRVYVALGVAALAALASSQTDGPSTLSYMMLPGLVWALYFHVRNEDVEKGIPSGMVSTVARLACALLVVVSWANAQKDMRREEDRASQQRTCSELVQKYPDERELDALCSGL